MVDAAVARTLAERYGERRVPEDAILGALEGWDAQDAKGLVEWARAYTQDPAKALKGWAKKRRSAFSRPYVAARFQLRRIEAGERRVNTKTARKIAGALGTTVAALTSEPDEGTALRHTAAAKLSTRGAA